MIWQPPLNPSAIVLGIAAAVLVCGLAIIRGRGMWRRRAVIIALRTIALATVCVLLLGPLVVRSDKPSPPPRVLHVLVDVSSSMGVDAPSRFAQATDIIKSLPDDAHGWAFADEVVEADAPPRTLREAASGTHLFEAIANVAAQAAPSDLLLIVSDGHDTTRSTEQPAIGAAQSRGIPLFVLPVGASDERRVIVSATPSRVFTGETVALRMITSGIFADEPVTVRRDGEVIATGLAEALTTCTHVPFTQDAEADAATYTVTIGQDKPVSGSTTVTHLGKRLRVLMIEGEPSWNSRFVAEALRNDSHVDLTVVQAISPKRHVVFRYAPSVRDDDEKATVSVPLTAADLSAFDLIVTGEALARCMTERALAALAQRAAQGNGLLMIGSPVTTFSPAPPAVADPSLALAFGRIGAGRVVQVTDAQVWRSLFASDDDAKRQAAGATLRAAARWAALGDPTPPQPPEGPPASMELLDTTARPDVLKRLAAATGGQVLAADNLQPLFDALTSPRPTPPPDPADLQPAWPRPWVFALLIVPLIAEWFIRRTGGMP